MAMSFAQATGSREPVTLSYTWGGMTASMAFDASELAGLRTKLASKPLPELWSEIEAQVKQTRAQVQEMSNATIEARRAERNDLVAKQLKHRQDEANFMATARANSSSWERQKIEANASDSRALAEKLGHAIYDFDNRFENELASQQQERRSKVSGLLKILSQLEFVAAVDSRVIANRAQYERRCNQGQSIKRLF